MTNERKREAAKGLSRLGAAVIGAVVGAGVLAAPASAGDLKLRLEWTPIVIHTWYFLAQDRGWYKEEGVNLTIEPGSGSVHTTQVVAAGSHDVGQAGQATAAAGRAQGLGVKSIGALIRKNEMGVLVPVDSPANSVKDLVDKKIKIVTSPGSFEIPFLDPWFKMGGTDFKQAQMMYVDTKLKGSTYLSGDADAVSTSVPFFRAIFSQKRPSRPILMAEVGMDVPGTGLIANDDAIKNKAAEIRGFLKATYRAFDYIVGQKNYQAGYDAMVKIRPEARGTPFAVIEQQFKDHEAFWVTDATKGKPWGYMAPEDWETAAKNLKLAGSIPQNANIKEYYTNELLPAATN